MVLASNICVLKCNIWVLASGVGVLRCETVQKSAERGMFLPQKTIALGFYKNNPNY
jgi:hypothetical protein